MTPSRIEQAGPGEQRELMLDAWDVIAKSRGLEWARCYVGSFCAKIDDEAYLDAAMMLVPDGFLWTLDSWDGPPRWAAGIWKGRSFVVYADEAHAASTPALALLSAILKSQENNQ